MGDGVVEGVEALPVGVEEVHQPVRGGLSATAVAAPTKSFSAPPRKTGNRVENNEPLGDLVNYLIPMINKLNLTDEEKHNNRLSTVQSQLITFGYRIPPEGIHDQKAINFYEQILKCNSEVSTVLKKGYSPPLISEPPNFKKRNNLSAQKEMAFVRNSFFQKTFLNLFVSISRNKPDKNLSLFYKYI